MGWKLKGTPRTLKVTNKMAREWAEMEAVGVDRPLSERRMFAYNKMWKAGEFRPVTWAKTYVKDLDHTYRVNGKHTSTLFSTADFNNGPDVYVIIEEYECDTVEDAANLYSTFDSQLQSRNTTDINRAFSGTVPELREYPPATINLIVGGLAFQNWPSTTGGTGWQTAADRAELILDNVEFAVWCNEILQGRSKTAMHLCRVPVVAAMLSTYKKSKSAATEFWTAVRDETGEKPEVPDRKLAKFLMTTKMASSSRATLVPQRYRITSKEYLVKSIRAWNAWRKKEPTSLAYSPDHKIPAAV